MEVEQGVFRILPRWVPAAYALLAVATIPWTIYLAVTLPTRHITHHWDVAWVGLDVAILSLLFMNAVFAARASKWVVMSATGTTSLLVADAWFDILSSRAGMQLEESIVLAIFVELPLAILTLAIAIKTLKRFTNIPETKTR